MKLNQVSGAFRSLYAVRDKRDGDKGQGQQQQNQQQSGSHEGDSKPFTQDLLDQAVEAFQGDTQNQASGLSAAVGPGLTVTLKDASGRVIRQLSGEEFVRMRESSTFDNRRRGKILDQKL